MKKLFYFVFGLVLMTSCDDKSIPESFIGKWDMTNDESSFVQRTLEIKEDNGFVETWTVFDDDGEQVGEIEIQGKCEFPATDGIGNNHALCLVYDLESLYDPDDLLEALEMEDYFENEKESYEAAKKRGQVYGFLDAYVSDFTLRFKGGQWKKEINEAMKQLLEGSN
jgi:hypothetical protein